MRHESPLDFDAEMMRLRGYRVVDALVDYWQSPPARPLGKRPPRRGLDAVLRCRQRGDDEYGRSRPP